EQLARHAGDHRRVGLGVVDDQLDLLAVDAACVVDFLGFQLGAIERRSVEGGQRTRNVERRADLDAVCQRPGRPGRHQSKSCGEQRASAEKSSPFHRSYSSGGFLFQDRKDPSVSSRSPTMPLGRKIMTRMKMTPSTIWLAPYSGGSTNAPKSMPR